LKKVNQIIVGILLPLSIGLFIYAAFRPAIKFAFLFQINLGGWLVGKQFFPSLHTHLPDGLFPFALFNYIIIFKTVWGLKKTFCITLFVCLTQEFLQLLKITHGTFDFYDILMIFMGSSGAIFFAKKYIL
jgi:hypothetical protein